MRTRFCSLLDCGFPPVEAEPAVEPVLEPAVEHAEPPSEPPPAAEEVPAAPDPAEALGIAELERLANSLGCSQSALLEDGDLGGYMWWMWCG